MASTVTVHWFLFLAKLPMSRGGINDQQGMGDCMEAFGPSNRSRRGSQSLGFGPNWTFGMSSGKLQLSGYFDPFLVPKKLQLVLK
jgi:hypothetical protein